MSDILPEKKYSQIPLSSIQNWAESVGVADFPAELGKSLSSDVTYRLKEIVNITKQFMHHNKRAKLTCDDFNRTLKWMDVPPILGYRGIDHQEWVHLPEAGIYTAQENFVNLSSSAVSADVFNQPGSPFVKGEWTHVSNHTFKTDTNSHERTLVRTHIPKELMQYYHAIFASLTNPSEAMFKKICNDIATSSTIESLVGPIVGGVLKGTQKARQKSQLLKRILLLIKALVFNPYIYLGPPNYMRDIVNVLVFCVVTERKSSQDTNSIRSLASGILLQLCRCPDSTAWDLSVVELAGVIGSNTRPWHQHTGGLTGLLTFGPKALDIALGSIAKRYCERLNNALVNAQKGHLSYKDTLDAHMTSGLLMCSFVKLVVSHIKKLPDFQEGDCNDDIEAINKIREYYTIAEEMYGDVFSLQIPPITLETSMPRVISEPNYIRVKKKLPYKKCDKIIPIEVYFKKYKRWQPVYRPIFMSIRGCSSLYHNALNRHRISTVLKPKTVSNTTQLTSLKIAPMPHRILGSNVQLKPNSYFLHQLIL